MENKLNKLHVDSETIDTWLPTWAQRNNAPSCMRSQLQFDIAPPKNTKSNLIFSLKKSKLGRIYQDYFKQRALIRCLAEWVLRYAFPLYAKYIIPFRHPEFRKWRSLIKISQFAKIAPEKTLQIVDKSVIKTTMIAVFPNKNQHHLGLLDDGYVFPESFVTRVKNAMVYGGTNLVLIDDNILYHDLYHFNQDYTSEELHGRLLIKVDSHCARWLVNDENPVPLDIAASFVDSCASNYAHWVTEVLPRICLFCTDERFTNIPIIINAGLHDNLMESLFLLCGDRKIFTLPIGRAVSVKELYLMSPTGYIPFEKRPSKRIKQASSQGLFSPYALKALRERLNEQLLIGNENLSVYPKKIYLRRKSKTRQLLNEAEIEAILINRGFSIIATEHLHFEEQLKLFQNAEIIIGPTGAACANIIFCNPLANIAILMGIHKNMPYKYWLNMSNAVGGQNISYILGNIVQNKELDFHGDYQIDINDLLDYLKIVNKKNNSNQSLYEESIEVCHPLVKLSTFADQIPNKTYNIADEAIVKVTCPVVFPMKAKKDLNLSNIDYLFPKIFITTAENAVVHGASNLIVHKNEVLCHDLYDFNRDYTSEELHQRVAINPKMSSLRWITYDKSPETIPIGAIFLDACASNYAHWLTEILPRVHLFCVNEQFKDIPIIINDDLHDNLIESLSRLDDKRKIITLSEKKALNVRELYITSPSGYIPFDSRNHEQKLGKGRCIFNSHALLLMKNHVLHSIGNYTKNKSPSKIFLRRNSHYRLIKNELCLQKKLISMGFTVIDPEQLSFSEQVQIFSNAEIVVGATGAAFANLIFCMPTTQIIICLSLHAAHSYDYWQNMAAAVGNQVKYVLGSPVLNMHDDFSINIRDVIHAFEC